MIVVCLHFTHTTHTFSMPPPPRRGAPADAATLSLMNAIIKSKFPPSELGFFQKHVTSLNVQKADTRRIVTVRTNFIKEKGRFGTNLKDATGPAGAGAVPILYELLDTRGALSLGARVRCCISSCACCCTIVATVACRSRG